MKKHLVDNPETYSSEDDILHAFFSEKLNRFCIEFNAKLFTFRTVSGYNSKLDYFKNKYKLTLSK